MDRFVEDGSLDENVESFLSHDDADPRDTVGRCMDVSKGALNVSFSWLNILISTGTYPLYQCNLIVYQKWKYNG